MSGKLVSFSFVIIYCILQFSNRFFSEILPFLSSYHLSVDKCYQAAKNAGKDYFAVQFYGECWVADDDSTYMKHGPSVACWSGVGKGLTNYVYKVEW